MWKEEEFLSEPWHMSLIQRLERRGASLKLWKKAALRRRPRISRFSWAEPRKPTGTWESPWTPSKWDQSLTLSFSFPATATSFLWLNISNTLTAAQWKSPRSESHLQAALLKWLMTSLIWTKTRKNT